MALTRYEVRDRPPSLRSLPAAALRAAIREGYSAADLRADVVAGLIVGVVALPLAMALAIAVGAPPEAGLYTSIVGGFVIALLGGSRTQVSGPTAAFVVILAPITARFGLPGLLVSGMLGGLMLAAMGLLRLGRLIQYIPHPVTTGFTAGIAVVIATLQVKDLAGLHLAGSPAHFADRVLAMWQARGTASLSELALGLGTFALLVLWPKVNRRIPAPLVALPVAALAGLALAYAGLAVDTIGTRFHTSEGLPGIPRLPPMPVLPWAGFDLTLDRLRELLPGAFAIAMLGAIESLLSAVVADGMARTRHDPDAELLAQGIGNVVAPFLGGIPATGAIARTATNIRSGARSPVASMVHAFTVLAAVLVLAPLVGYLPMTALAALLVLVAWNMSEARHFAHTVRVAPRSDVTVLLTCFGLTVLFDMVIAVSTGIVLAALLFMRRMAEITQARIVDAGHAALPRPLPEGVLLYDISGPLFFGAAEKAMSALGSIAGRTRVVMLRMDQVPVMDATGLVALESALRRLEIAGCRAVIAGVQPQPARLLKNAGIQDRPGKLLLRARIEDALDAAEEMLKQVPSGSRSRPDVPVEKHA